MFGVLSTLRDLQRGRQVGHARRQTRLQRELVELERRRLAEPPSDAYARGWRDGWVAGHEACTHEASG